MLNNKYSKVLTVILIIAIIGIIGLLAFLGIDWYTSYTLEADARNIMDQFDGLEDNYIEQPEQNITTNEQSANNEVVNPNIQIENVEGTSGNGSGGSSTEMTYKGFKVAGRIQIPKTDVNYPVLTEATPNAISVAIGILYGPGINEVGNTVLIGHNFRNGTFFSNNKKLTEGDKIYLTDTTGKKVTYEIYKKSTLTPTDFDYANRDTQGKREISLSTCTDDSSKRIVIFARETN